MVVVVTKRVGELQNAALWVSLVRILVGKGKNLAVNIQPS